MTLFNSLDQQEAQMTSDPPPNKSTFCLCIVYLYQCALCSISVLFRPWINIIMSCKLGFSKYFFFL